ncbi:MAG: phosphoribosyltransferase [Candidatus Hodarchaeales archaeon]|jgi:hypoxanthine phosphoribosyltransferase
MTSEDRSPSTEKLIMSHDDFVSYVKELAETIKVWEKENFVFDALVPIKRGGLVVATYLSHLLNDKPIDTDPVLREHILFVDDIVDTGETMKRLQDADLFWIFKVNWKRSRFASIATKPWAVRQPHFSIFETKKWIVFPWELYE